MNKKLLLLGMVAAMTFTACQQDEISDSITENEAQLPLPKTVAATASTKIHEPVRLDSLSAQIHEPVLTGPGSEIHEPDWFEANAWFSCGSAYEGNGNLTVTRNKEQSYCDHFIELNKISVGGTLNMYAEEGLHVANTVNTHYYGVFNFMGDMEIGTADDPQDLVINYGSHFVFQGNIHVTGNLVINNGGTFTMMGHDHQDHTFIVDGDIIIEEGAILEDEAGDPSEHDADHTHE
ncbi:MULTISPECIES: hypothetical protein [Christiangramia]|uniref:Uncharacterized protein n=1 Tax=Christiangramia flava JLT2011 TaxID=1229726 RepID=A0A1L7I3W0_9FLAO|nr:hypothetical protein [Christiangramia flava]APU68261.1 hypothetical protein GRFL_1537 [Christiangramia flava JLT2011]OSS40952.1 secreted protein [Christiangramia flava JLT2011]